MKDMTINDINCQDSAGKAIPCDLHQAGPWILLVRPTEGDAFCHNTQWGTRRVKVEALTDLWILMQPSPERDSLTKILVTAGWR